jgi:acetoin utilization deacetylase AcuC-like enzyme
MMDIFYTPKQVNTNNNMGISFSKSPLKPKLVMDELLSGIHAKDLVIHDFNGLTQADFEIAHKISYVKEFLTGGKRSESNGIPWSKELVESVAYTNGSLYHAIKYATENENAFVLSPTSGFHHAQPANGRGFCTFSGQVIASVKRYRETGAVGAYLDLDGHFGNSIGDSVKFCPDVLKAITLNLNPSENGEQYLDELAVGLDVLERQIETGLDYVVWCHGADSHEDDDLGGYVNTQQWLQCSEMFYEFVQRKRSQGFNVPVVASLFGGYSRKNYGFVINLHASDIEMGIDILEPLTV